MESKGEFVPAHEEDKWLTDSVLLVDLITHLNELSTYQGKNQLICAMFPF